MLVTHSVRRWQSLALHSEIGAHTRRLQNRKKRGTSAFELICPAICRM
jgi:hypothetical protein